MAAPTVTFQPLEGSRPAAVCPLGMGPPRWSDVAGRWETEDRPGRKTLPFYGGRPLRQVVVPVLFDGWAAQRTVDGDVARLERLCDVDEALGRPPALLIVGPVFDWSMTCQISDLEYGDSIVAGDGFRFRLEANVTLLEWVEADVLVRSVGGRQRTRDGGGRRRTTYTVRRGDTVRGIAKRLLGNPGRAGEIVALNRAEFPAIRDRRNIDRLVGKVIRLPAHYR